MKNATVLEPALPSQAKKLMITADAGAKEAEQVPRLEAKKLPKPMFAQGSDSES